MSFIRSVVLGCGSYLPEKTLTNAQLSEIVDTSDDWIIQRTGIRERHIAAEGELTSDLATAAAKLALSDAGLTIGEIDMIIVATATPDDTFPATAVTVQRKLGMELAPPSTCRPSAPASCLRYRPRMRSFVRARRSVSS